MARLGPPLGLDSEFCKDQTNMDYFLKHITLKIVDESKIRFADVLEELVMLAFINKEVSNYLKEQEGNVEYR